MHHVISFFLRIAYAIGFGYILVWHPEDIITYVPQLLGGALMMECVAQFLELFILKAKTRVNNGFFIIPSIILLISLYMIFSGKLDIKEDVMVRELLKPEHGMSFIVAELMFAGVCFIGFVISELAISIRFFTPLYRPAKFAEQKEKERLELERERLAQIAAENAKKGNTEAN